MEELKKYQIKSDILSSEIGGEIVLLDVPSGKYFKVDEIGSKIWELIKESRTINEVVALLMKDYEVSKEKCQEDVLAFFDKLEENNFLEN